MTTPIITRDLTKQAPHSPRERIAGFAIASRAVDKCRASLAGTLGEYHYDCPLDNLLFSFKGINGEQFKTAVQSAKNYEDVGIWLQANGTTKTPVEIKAWSDEMEAGSLMKNPEKRAYFMERLLPARTESSNEHHVRLARSGRPRKLPAQIQVTLFHFSLKFPTKDENHESIQDQIRGNTSDSCFPASLSPAATESPGSRSGSKAG